MKFWTETDLICCIRKYTLVEWKTTRYKYFKARVIPAECLGLQAWHIKGDAFAKL